MKSIQLGISDFAVPSPRRGSIETYSGYGPLPQVGNEIHLTVQQQRREEHPGYKSEKWITHTFQQDTLRIVVSGRMDGQWPASPTHIEEIKSAYNPAELIKALERNPDHPYRLQLLTYSYLHWLGTGESPRASLHIVSSRTRHGVDFAVELDRERYEAWLARRLLEIAQEAAVFDKLKKRRKKLSAQFQFPFSAPRRGQVELMQTVQTTLNTKTALLIQAPTGLGKTAGVLYPSLQEALARGQKLIYLTPKNTQHAVAEDAVERLHATGTKARSLTIHAKAKMCFKEQVICNPDYCEYAKNYYDKVSDHKLVEKLSRKKRLTFRTFEKVGRQYEVCPFELQLDNLNRADVVICDYNYVFSPRNSLGRINANGFDKKSLPNVVIDEAHNLPGRAREYYSAEMNAEHLRELQAGFLHLAPDLRKTADRLIDDSLYLLESSAGPGAHKPVQVELDVESFLIHGAKVQEFISRYLESPSELRPGDRILAFGNSWASFTQAIMALSEEFFCTFTPTPVGGILKITCCDASTALNEGYNAFANVVAFSATVKPFDYYAQLLGFSQRAFKTAEFASPFPAERRKLLIVPQVSTKYSDREANYGKIKQGIERIVALQLGNYFVFFPSFEFLRRVGETLDVPGFSVLWQKREMKRRDVQQYLDQLQRADQPTLILAVQGGVFSEGVDYPGEMLIGALVVGPALPTFDFERELLRAYYEKKNGRELAFDYAYTYPAMAKVIQSAGRVIRSADDRGLIVLMDRRFVQSSYVKAMPADWGEAQAHVSQQLLTDIRRFWEENAAEAK